MKITGGKHNGRALTYPKGIRPTSDKVRESIFGTLRERTLGAIVLDLYAGSGALGFEALSRGSKSLTTVDNFPGSVAAIRKNAAQLQEEVTIISQEVGRFVERHQGRFDLIFADPPYSDIKWDVLERTAKLLNVEGLLIVEYAARVLPPESMEAAHEVDRRRFGDTQVSYFSPAQA